MTRKRENPSITRVLDDAIADPARLRELRRALRARISLLESEDLSIRSPASLVGQGDRVPAEQYDDSLWDNVPV